MKPASRLPLYALLAFVICLGLGWFIAWLCGDPKLVAGGWIITGLVLYALVLGLAGLWKLAGGGQVLGWLLAVAFVVRLVVGTGLDWGLPRFGYPDSEEHRSGYFYTDAFRRDTAALALARSDQPLASVFSQDFASDQYGGLLSLSAWVYRYLSPNAARPHLMMLFSAAAGSAGIVFVWALARRRWGGGRGSPAATASLVYALYPQSIVLGATQMREPYLISAAAAILWALSVWQLSAYDRSERRKAVLVWAAGLLVMIFFSSKIALAAAVISAVFLLWEAASGLERRYRPFLAAAAATALIITLVLTWNWLRYSTLYDTYLAEKQSGWVQQVFDILPDQAQVPFIIGYGLVQPVLPATVSDLALPVLVPADDPARVDLAPGLLRQINFWLALGWYILLPALVYGLFAAWRAQPPEDRRLLVLAAVFSIVWALVSSARAGGDQWDNPRYRTIFIAWQALAFGWGLQYARKVKDAWLGRFYLITGIFFLFFTEWYISRYTRLVGRLSFFTLLAAIAGLSLVVIVGGWLWDRYRGRKMVRTG